MANRLAAETSPYLRQHAHNPVEWYPWSEDAFVRARSEDKPILLSIGYSACHWCHVMERESFDDPSIAALMNELFVCVKVDREERPDLDQIYQLVVQRMGRNGGWPLTVFLTPDRRPFFGGTYFPPAERHGMPGLPTVLRAVHEAWRDRRRELEASATALTDDIATIAAARSDPGEVPRDAARIAARRLAQRFDEQHGGFGDRPKFPNTMALEVMLRAAHDGDAGSQARVRKALDAMRAGGVRDLLGGGFHRYSTDARWLVPHFEKMLYDNALLLRLYAEAHRAMREPSDTVVARGIVAWLEREMRSPDGAFYASQDADSEGEEGRFFVWRPEELDAILSDEESAVARLCFGVSPGGNFESTGASVLHENRPIALAARQLGIEEARAKEALERARVKMFAAREARPRPFRDEKVIATWNGLMIGALAEAGGALGDDRMIALAREALAAAKTRLWIEGALRRIWIEGAARIPGFLEDHADLAGAAIDVYEAADDRAALAWARELAEAAIDQFWSEEDGAFHFAPRDATDLIARTRDAYDHAVPSGTSSIVHALLRLAAHFGEDRYSAIAERVLRAHAQTALEQPMAFGHLVCAMDRYVRGATEVIVVAREDDPAGRELLAAARQAWIPNRVLARVDPDRGENGLAVRLGGRGQEGGLATAYVCRDRTCGLPCTSAEALLDRLRP